MQRSVSDRRSFAAAPSQEAPIVSAQTPAAASGTDLALTDIVDDCASMAMGRQLALGRLVGLIELHSP